MSKHTPGPWQVGNLCINDYEPRNIEIMKGKKLIGKAIYGRTDEDCAENAHLMAASPELLKLAEKLHDALSDIMEDGRIEYQPNERKRLLSLMKAGIALFYRIEGGV
jgi:hypothetical protein